MPGYKVVRRSKTSKQPMGGTAWANLLEAYKELDEATITLSRGAYRDVDEYVITPEQRYVVGFLFDDQGTDVVLVKKAHPEWQAGKLNGPGGRIEMGESPVQAMAREFREECTVEIAAERWERTVDLWDANDQWVVHFFRAFGTGEEVFACESPDGVEPVRRVDRYNVPRLDVIPNLLWLIPLCADHSGIVFPITMVDQT